MTLHPRVYLLPANFSAMVLPFWLFMTRNLYVETGDVSVVLWNCRNRTGRDACVETAVHAYRAHLVFRTII